MIVLALNELARCIEGYVVLNLLSNKVVLNNKLSSEFSHNLFAEFKADAYPSLGIIVRELILVPATLYILMWVNVSLSRRYSL